MLCIFLYGAGQCVLNVKVAFSVISPLISFCWHTQALPLALHTVWSELVSEDLSSENLFNDFIGEALQEN